MLDIILRNSKRLKQLTEDVLDVASIESGSFFLNKEKFNLKEMITDVLKEYKQTIQNKNNIKFFLEFNDNNDEIIIVEADRNRLSQVIHNLLHNALKFTKEGSITVIVEIKKDNTNDKYDEILVSIKDTGTGIHPEVLPKLFTRFATKSPIAGTGLGLFISKSIIEMHGGKIWATNNKEKDKDVRLNIYIQPTSKRITIFFKFILIKKLCKITYKIKIVNRIVLKFQHSFHQTRE